MFALEWNSSTLLIFLTLTHAYDPPIAGADKQSAACSRHAVPDRRCQHLILCKFPAITSGESRQDASLQAFPCAMGIFWIDYIRRASQKDSVSRPDYGSDSDADALLPKGFRPLPAPPAHSLLVPCAAGGGFQRYTIINA